MFLFGYGTHALGIIGKVTIDSFARVVVKSCVSRLHGKKLTTQYVITPI